jgi:DNA-binding response OmpR family regulator
LTNELIELHNGQIRVDSSRETGTTFIINLPIGKEHLQESEVYETSIQISQQVDTEPVLESEVVKQSEARIQKGLPLIMIVEDNPDFRFYIRGYIEPVYRIIEAVDGKEGLHKAIDKIPDLIISDVMMPEMDGIDLCRKLKTDERTSHIPLILLTARAESQDKINGLESGADDYLTKPFDAKELLVRIKNLISQREKLHSHYLKTFSMEIDTHKLASIDQKFITKTQSIIEMHISDSEFSIHDFAREIGFSHSQLIRKLESLTGLKPSLYIRTYRLQRAKQLFDQKSGNISQIAYDCGFSNLSYFSRSFKAQFGLLPSDYLKHIS